MSIEEQVEDQFEDDQFDEEQETASVEPESEEELEETEMVSESDDDDDDEVVVTIGEDSPPQEEDEGFNGQPAPQWVKDLRKENRELKKQLKAPQQEQPKQEEIKLGEKPKLENFGYDEEEFTQALDIWYDQKALVEKRKKEQEAALEAQQAEFQKVIVAYNEQKSKLKVRDYDDAESEVTETLSVQQQGFILEGADNPALVVYALGKDKTRLKELAKITNPAKFAFAVAKLETQMKTTKRKAAVAPEKSVNGTGSTSGTTNTTLERLRAEAEKTGDFSKLGAYKRKLKQSK